MNLISPSNKSHQCSQGLFCAVNRSTEVGMSRIPFKAQSCPELNMIAAWEHTVVGAERPEGVVQILIQAKRNEFPKPNSQTKRKENKTSPNSPTNCMEAMTRGRSGLKPFLISLLFSIVKRYLSPLWGTNELGRSSKLWPTHNPVTCT